MTTQEIAFDKTLSFFCKCEESSNGEPSQMLFLLMQGIEDPEFTNELCKFSTSCFQSGKPMQATFLHGIIFYQQYIRNKELIELEEWNKFNG
jgi:hypothetical protein